MLKNGGFIVMINKAVTDARVKKALYGHFKTFIDDENIPDQITKKIAEHSIKKGTVIEVYHHIDKSLVKLSNGEEVEAWHLHRCLGSIVDLYTPEGEVDFSERINEPCIIPRFELKALVAEVGDKEYVLLGYYNPNMVGAYNPADTGTYFIKTLTDTSQGGLKITPQEIKLISNTGAAFMEQDLGESKDINYANSDDTYTKSEVYKKSQTYSKTKIDALLKEIWDYIKPEEEEEDGE